MSVFDKLREGIFKIRVVPKDTAEDYTTFHKDKDSVGKKVEEAESLGKRIDLTDFLNITTLKGNRNNKYAAFEEMISDGRISAAVEMYANDTVQYNPEGKLIWIESSNTDVAKYGNKLLEDLNISENLWSWAYSLWLYGDVYLETFKETSTRNNKPTLLVEPVNHSSEVRKEVPIEGAKLARYIEKVPNPADIYDLQYKGKTSGFVRSETEIKNELNNNIYEYQGSFTKLNILNPTKYVHICLSPNINRFPEKFRIIKDSELEKKTKDGYIDISDSEGTNGDNITFTVKSGQSILENVYGAYKTLKLKEESVLLERLTKSSITRVIQVELGDLPESQKRKKLAELKQQIEQQINLNKDTGTIESRAGAQPSENIIYTTTKNGKGTISTVNIGGDAEIGNTEDIDKSENKLYGSLLTPKALLGADMEGSGLSNGGSLTEMNTTYARRIKRGQVALQSGIKTLINIFALNDGLDDVVNNFQVKLTPIITVEDNRRDELLDTKIRNVDSIMSLIDKTEQIDDDTKLKMLIQWLSKYLNQQDIVGIINEMLNEQKVDETEELQDKHESELDGDTDIDINVGGSSSFNEPVPTSSFSEPLETETDEESEESTAPELSDQENLSDIQGEDLL